MNVQMDQIATVEIDHSSDAAAFIGAGITCGAKIMTLEGELPVQYLAEGDMVVTRNGARKLRAIEVSLVNDAEMIRIAASALGHDRPEQDLFVAPGQLVLVRDWRAQALFGSNQAVVEARRLVDGHYVRPERVAEIRLFTLHFADAEVVYADGLELACAPLTVAA